MKVLIDIPKEFEVDYHTDRFRDFFERAVADMDVMCGTYERETADVLAKAFEESRLYDPDKVVEQLEELKKAEQNRSDNCDENGFGDGEQIYDDGRSQGRFEAFGEAIKIVKGGGVDGN